MEILFSLDELHNVANGILEKFPTQRCFAFYAEMGSGKTTMIRALCEVLQVKDNVSSPTFSIINEYATRNGLYKVYHMDWYRLKNTQDAIEAGVEDILQQKSAYCFIEWPEIAPNLLPVNAVSLSLSILSENERMLKIL